MLTTQTKVLLLDNTRDADGEGIIRVFNIADKFPTVDIVPSTTLSFVTFGASSTAITDMAVLNTSSTNVVGLVVSLKDVGLGYTTLVNN